MLVAKKSMFTGKTNEMEIPLSYDAMACALKLWQDGMLIQEAFPTLNADQREFIQTGSTPEEWEQLFS